jgi:hypothetical protein
MSDVKTLSVEELQAAWEHEIPCGGVRTGPYNMDCDRAATLASRSHHGDCTYFKCVSCWQIWYKHIFGNLLKQGYVWCIVCGERFFTVEAFSDYRPF